jgi:hypothetical protein
MLVDDDPEELIPLARSLAQTIRADAALSR